MVVRTKGWTYEGLLETPDDGLRYEIIDGALFVSAAPISKHQLALSETNDLVNGFVRVNDLGRVFFAPVDVFFSDTNVVEPDLIYVSWATFSRSGEKRLEGPPDLVVEVLSPGTREIDLARKMALYAKYGVPEYWIIDPETETTRILFLVDGVNEEQRADDLGRMHSCVLTELAFGPSVIFEVIYGGYGGPGKSFRRMR